MAPQRNGIIPDGYQMRLHLHPVEIVHRLPMKNNANALLTLATPNKHQTRPNQAEDIPNQDLDGPPHTYPDLHSPFHEKPAKTPDIGLNYQVPAFDSMSPPSQMATM
ncbi:hypothetical protein P691DRAFT_768286 [Macrolepiota fuliginosa MF-IS2]|uniref:Uncharacterized protein n=1 Tax=Macrolepiota fuliginosa MF-IS2 TaxID=1400762 RepID=A0A9P6BUI7_9AGAR|nr:hypothetical protein P691DRAFT_768286 [Macrolepiota fuliginosa MF-IS2]